MISKEVEAGKLVGFSYDGKTYKGKLLNWDLEEKYYEISVTHVDGVLIPPTKDNVLGTKVVQWDGPLMVLVA